MSGDIEPTERLRSRFFSKIEKRGDCWHWTGSLKPDGYPKSITVDGRQRRVSHVALTLDGRPRVGDLLALHSCDNPKCVNPSHLRWGTELDNRKDAIARWKGKGRSFSPDEVRYIRASSARNIDLAKEFGVSQACVCTIRKGRSHKHVF